MFIGSFSSLVGRAFAAAALGRTNESFLRDVTHSAQVIDGEGGREGASSKSVAADTAAAAIKRREDADEERSECE